MTTHMGQYITEPELPVTFVETFLAGVAAAYESLGLTDSDGAAIDDYSEVVWWRRVPTGTEPPYGQILQLEPGRWQQAATRSAVPLEVIVTFKHTSFHPDEALQMAQATYARFTGQPFVAPGFTTTGVDRAMKDLFQPEYREGSSADLYHYNQKLRFRLWAFTN